MLRPVNVKTDLAPLADLIELVFASTMDSAGRSALREMRMMARMTVGLGWMARLNDLTVGISLGFVWIEQGKLVGNVSIYPAKLPKSAGKGWIIANVGVHPSYQRRGIARELMIASMNMIKQRGGEFALLQVDHDNAAAVHLYRALGFVDERTFTTYRRSPSLRYPDMELSDPPYIRRRRRSEWRHEMALAARLRPNVRGGVGWLRPVVPELFKPNWSRAVNDLVNMRVMDRFIIDDHSGEINAVMWVERAFGSTTRLTLMTDPTYSGVYDETLIGSIVRQMGGNGLVIEHPADDQHTKPLLDRYRFLDQRTVTHMRWDVN
jgi:ribosomal protein S18 acetylase RimI-like enzyme